MAQMRKQRNLATECVRFFGASSFLFLGFRGQDVFSFRVFFNLESGIDFCLYSS